MKKFFNYYLVLLASYIAGAAVFLLLDICGLYTADGSSMFHGAEWIIVPVYSAVVNILSVPMSIVFHSSGYIIPFLLISVFAVYFNEFIKKLPVK